MRYAVQYHTLNDTYTKVFKNKADAIKFRDLIKALYPEQNPTVGVWSGKS